MKDINVTSETVKEKQDLGMIKYFLKMTPVGQKIIKIIDKCMEYMECMEYKGFWNTKEIVEYRSSSSSRGLLSRMWENL